MRVCALLALVCAVAARVQHAARSHRDIHPRAAKGKVQIGYFPNWGIYARNFQPTDIVAAELTHILYAFADVDPTSGEIVLSDPYADLQKHFPTDSWDDTGNNVYGCIKQLYLLKLQRRNLKVLLSVGGWTYSQAGHFSFVTDSTLRSAFVNSAVTMVENLGLDGIDIDFEFPTAGQKNAFTSLVAELRTAFTALEHKNKEKTPYQITAAMPAAAASAANFDVHALNKMLDYFNLMAYDYGGSWSNVSADLANVYGGVTGVDTYAALQRYGKAGASSSKIALGIPLYGRAFEDTAGLYKPYNGVGPGTWEAGVYDYKALPRAGATVHENFSTIASYSYDKKSRELVSYDTPRIVTDKAKFALEKGLAGGMYWDLSSDKVGKDSLVANMGKVFGKLDTTQNHIHYPGSIYDNIRNNMAASTASSSASTSSSTGSGASTGTSSTGSGSSTGTSSTGSGASTGTPAPSTGGACGGVAAWNNATVYVAGNSATFAGHYWTAQWWTQGDTPGGTTNVGVWLEGVVC